MRVKRARAALAVTFAIAAVVAAGSTDGLRNAAPAAASPEPSPTPAPGGGAVSPLLRLDVPKVGGPFTARLSPDARLVAVEAVGARTGVTMYEIRPPVPPSELATLRELVRLDQAAYPVQWLRDSSGFLVYEPDAPSSPTGVLSLVGTSGKRWSIPTPALGAVHEAQFSPDGRYVAMWTNQRQVLIVALNGAPTYLLGGEPTEHFAGWDGEANLLFHDMTASVLEARRLDGHVVYTVPVPDELRELSANLPTFPQPSDVQLLWFDAAGCCRSSVHAARVFFDRKLHEIPAGLEDLRLSLGEGPWRGRELTMRRKVDEQLMAFDPRSGMTRSLGVKLPYGHSIWGISGDYLAAGRHIVQLSTGIDLEWTVEPGPESIIPLAAGRFVLWRDGTTELLDAGAWFAAPQVWTGELPVASDQSRVPPGWVRVRDDDGGFTLVRPRSWSSYEGRARGAVLASGGLLPSATPGRGDVRVEIRVDISGPRGPADFLDGLAHHGGRVIERRSVQLSGESAEFAIIHESVAWPSPTTSLNWALRSPFLPDRVVWIRAWPLDSGRRAEVEAVIATLELVAPR